MVLTQPVEEFKAQLMALCFHTTMVLTQHRRSWQKSERKSSVSIPLWFSRNRPQRHPLGNQNHVSIPLWFSRNRSPNSVGASQLLLLFPYHYGSHATVSMENGKKWITQVSIPLWFSRNGSSRCSYPSMGDKFPYHYGSYATWPIDVGKRKSRPWFPYHYGSYATWVKARKEHTCQEVSIPLWFLRNNTASAISRKNTKFPYHYGSYATCSHRKFTVWCRSVSIPLWFLRNDHIIRPALDHIIVSIPLWFLRNYLELLY